MALKKKDKKKNDGQPKVNTVIEDGEAKPAAMVLSPGPVEKKVEAKPAKPEEKTPERAGLLKITARQYIQARGIRWERAAGFLHWAASKHGAGHLLTVPEWTETHRGFDTTPVGRV